MNTTKRLCKLFIPKYFLLLLFGLISHTITAQFTFDKSVYEGFKINKSNAEEFPDLMNIHITKMPSSGLITFSDSKSKPLDGTYHIIVHNQKYIVADFSKGLLDGEWALHWYGSVAEKATYKKGKMDGEVHLKYNDHEVYTIKNDVIQHYIAHYPNGQLKKEMFYENGKLNGTFKEYREDGRLSSITSYDHGQPHGEFMESNDEGYTWIKNYKKGVLCGEYLEKTGEGVITEKGTYDEKGNKTGRWVSYEKDGTIREDVGYLDGKYHGEYRTYHKGKVSLFIEYDQGKYNGKYISYSSTHPDVITEEKTYSRGLLNGPERYFDPEKGGMLYLEIFNEDGKAKIRREFDYSTGTIKLESTYGDHSIIRQKVYDQKGKLRLLRLVNEMGDLVDVQEYNTTTGKVTKTNKEYKKPKTIVIKEDPSGVIDIE